MIKLLISAGLKYHLLIRQFQWETNYVVRLSVTYCEQLEPLVSLMP